MDKCGVCGNPATETHHIRYQESKDSCGFVAPGIQVHRASNLVPLCEACHSDEHHGTLCISGYVQTSDGIRLRWTRNTQDSKAAAAAAAAAELDGKKHDICHGDAVRFTSKGWMMRGASYPKGTQRAMG